MSQHKTRRPRQHRNDVAMDARAEREVVIGKTGDPAVRIEEEADSILAYQWMLQSHRHTDRAVLAVIHLGIGAVQQKGQRVTVLGQITEVRIALCVIECHRTDRLDVRRDVKRYPRPLGQSLDLLFDAEVRTVHVLRRAADHRDMFVTEPKITKVVAGELSPDTDRRRPVEHGPNKPAHRWCDVGGMLVRAFDGGLCTYADHADGDGEPFDQIAERIEAGKEAHPKRIRERDNKMVILRIDLLSVAVAQPGRRHYGVASGK